MGGGSQQQQSGPPSWMIPHIQDIINQAASQYQNYNPKYYPNSTVGPQSNATLQGQSGLTNFGTSAGNQAAIGGAYNSSAALQGASDPTKNMALGAGQESLGGNMNYLSNTQNSSPTQVENLGSATGQNTANSLNSAMTMTPGSNPYVDELVKRSLGANTTNFNEQIMPNIDNQSQIEGGYGGTRQGVAQGVAVGKLLSTNADASSSIYANQYNADLNRQLQAAGVGANVAQGASSAELGRTGQGLTATGMGLDMLNTGYTSSLDAARNNMALSPALQPMGTYGANASMQAGASEDAYQQALVQDQINRWNFEQDLPYDKLNQYANLVYGGSGVSGSQTSMSGGGSGALGAAGGAAMGAGVASAMSSAGMLNAWNPWGWALMAGGALLGYLGQR